MEFNRWYYKSFRLLGFNRVLEFRYAKHDQRPQWAVYKEFWWFILAGRYVISWCIRRNKWRIRHK